MMRFSNVISTILILLFSLSIAGQTNLHGVIEGRIVNQKTNEPIPFASLIIWGTNIGTVSDLDGRFKFTDIAPGYVQVAASSIGFEEYLSERFWVTNANKAFINITLAEVDIKIDEVVVKASIYRKKEESPLSLQRIGIEQIEKNPGGNRDVSKVIQSLPGVASSVSFRNDVIVRGGAPNENSFYLDGVEIPTINHFATQGSSGGPVGIINVDFVREINFYSGAFPVNIGNSLSSVIDIRQKDGNPDKLKFRGSLGSSDLALTLDGPVTENTSIIFSARRSYLQFLFAALELPFLPTYNDFQFKSKTRLNEKNEITFIGLGAIDQFKLNLNANDTPEQKYLLSTLPVYNQWNYTIGAVYKHYRLNGYDSYILSRNHLNNISYKYPNNDETQAKQLDYNSAEIENKFRFERNLTYNNKLKVNFGLGTAYAKYSNNTKTTVYANQELNLQQYKTMVDMFHYALFGNANRTFLDNRLMLSLGLRADGSSYSSEMNNPLGQISPRLSASYLITPKLTFNVNTGRYYQRPPYTSMGYKDNNGVLVNKENGLKYLKSDQLVAGFELQPTIESILSVEAFYKNYSDYPFSVHDSIPLSTKGADFGAFGIEEVVPLSNGRAYGFEVLGRSQNILGFNLILSYTFVRSEFKDLRTKYFGEYIPSSWDNRHLLNFTGTRIFKNNWYLGFKWRFVGGTPYTAYDYNKSSIKDAWDAQGGPYIDFTKFNELRFKPYHQLDLRVDKEFFFNNWSLNLYIDIQNIYNSKSDQQAYLVRNSFVEPGYNDSYVDVNGIERYELVELSAVGSGTILPTIGIIVEF
jgi:hypothetical protein